MKYYLVFGMKPDYSIHQLTDDFMAIPAHEAEALAEVNKADFKHVGVYCTDNLKGDTNKEILYRVTCHLQPLEHRCPYLVVDKFGHMYSYYSTEAFALESIQALNGEESDYRKKSQPYTLSDWATHEAGEKARNVTVTAEVTKEDYWDMLEVLPPMNWGIHHGINSFFMSEFNTGSYTNQFAEIGDKYYSKGVDYNDKSTWIQFDNLPKEA